LPKKNTQPFDDRKAIVHVEDTGKGIAPEMLLRVFARWANSAIPCVASWHSLM
jgi:hypothetical protein